MIGGSADLSPVHQDQPDLRRLRQFSEAEKYSGRNLHFGIREHAMGSVTNGLNLCNIRAMAPPS